MTDLKTIKLGGKTYGVTPASHAQDKNDPHEVTPAQIGAKVANTIEPIAHGGTGANTAAKAMSNLSKLHQAGDGEWQSAEVGISAWHYEVQDKTGYNIPTEGCEILVLKHTPSRGTAIALGWINGQPQMWRNNLHDDTYSNKWTGWVDVRDAIDAAPAADTTLFRGTLTASDDWGTAKTHGRYWCYTWNGSGGSYPIVHDSGHLYVTVSELVVEQVYHSYNGYRCQRWYEKSSDTWSAWEWEIPPMVLGVEYRTTERYNGKAVYTKLLDFGTLPNTTAKYITYTEENTTIVGAQAIARRTSDGFVKPIPFFSNGGGCEMVFEVNPATKKVAITTLYDCSAFTGEVTLRYVKD